MQFIPLMTVFSVPAPVWRGWLSRLAATRAAHIDASRSGEPAIQA